MKPLKEDLNWLQAFTILGWLCDEWEKEYGKHEFAVWQSTYQTLDDAKMHCLKQRTR